MPPPPEGLPLDLWTRPRGDREGPAALAVGTMNFGKRTPPAEAERIMARALERGLRLFDTANAYGDGESERIVGAALRNQRDRVAIATKVGFGRVDGKPEGLSRERVLSAFDRSRQELGTDYVDIYYLHVPDPRTPIDDTLSAIAELFQRGQLRAFGVSNYASWQILEILLACDRMAIPRPVVSQQLYNLLIRQLDVEYFRFAAKYSIHNTTYNALAGGLLSDRHLYDSIPAGSRFDKNRLYQGRYWSARFFELRDAYRAIAEEHGWSLVELAYAWLAGRPGVDSILVGPASVEQLDAAIDGCSRALPAGATARIDELYRAFLGTDASYAR